MSHSVASKVRIFPEFGVSKLINYNYNNTRPITSEQNKAKNHQNVADLVVVAQPFSLIIFGFCQKLSKTRGYFAVKVTSKLYYYVTMGLAACSVAL